MSAPITARPGRNEPCHCGSGRKYKHCCLESDNAQAAAAKGRNRSTSRRPPAQGGHVDSHTSTEAPDAPALEGDFNSWLRRALQDATQGRWWLSDAGPYSNHMEDWQLDPDVQHLVPFSVSGVAGIEQQIHHQARETLKSAF